MPDRSKGRSQTKRDTLDLQVGGWAQGQQPRPGKKPKTAKNAQLWKAGWNNRWPKRVTRNKKENIYLGTWKGRPRLRWEDNVRNDLRKMGVKNWKRRAQERKQWKEIIEQAKTHKRVVELKKKKTPTLNQVLKLAILKTILRKKKRNNSKSQQKSNHRLQQVADYQLGNYLKERPQIFILLSVQQKV
jgi:hypothetical protein